MENKYLIETDDHEDQGFGDDEEKSYSLNYSDNNQSSSVSSEFSTSEFSSKGIFGPQGLLAALDFDVDSSTHSDLTHNNDSTTVSMAMAQPPLTMTKNMTNNCKITDKNARRSAPSFLMINPIKIFTEKSKDGCSRGRRGGENNYCENNRNFERRGSLGFKSLIKSCKLNSNSASDSSSLSKSVEHVCTSSSSGNFFKKFVSFFKRKSLPGKEVDSAPHTVAFAIDHIIELIFEELDCSTLLTCRLVSHRWAFYGSKELQKHVTLSFRQLNSHLNDPSYSYFLRGNPRRSLKNLSTLMSFSQSFPCNSFRFYDTDALYPFAQAFFSTCGPQIKKLEFDARNTSGRQPEVTLCPIFFSDIKRLLLEQAPNLETLILRGNLVFKQCQWKSYKINPRTRREMEATSKLPTNGELCDVSLFGVGKNDSDDDAPKPKKLNLKILECKREIPREIFEEILEATPKLSRVQLHDKNLHYFVKPANRLHLLQTLVVHISKETVDSLELLVASQKQQKQHQGNWKLRELTLYGGCHTNNKPRAADVISKVLSCSADSLEKLVWGQMRFLKCLQIPKLRRVRELTLNYYDSRGPAALPNRATQFFPIGLSLGETFPNLNSIHIENLSSTHNSITIEDLFDNWEPAPAVRKLSSTFILYPSLMESFREMFPNASFHVTDERFMFVNT